MSPDDLYDPDAPEDLPSQDALDAAVDSEQAREKSADTNDADAPVEPPAPESATPEGDAGTVTVNPDEHFDTLSELDSDEDPKAA